MNRHELAWSYLEDDGYTTTNNRWIIEAEIKEAIEWCEFVEKNYGDDNIGVLDDGSHWHYV